MIRTLKSLFGYKPTHSNGRKSPDTSRQPHTPYAKRKGERGNVFFTLFGAVAVVGVLGAGVMSTMRGPLTTMVEINKLEEAKAEMRVSARLIVAESANNDCAGDTDTTTGSKADYKEIIAPKNCSGPTGGGCIPDSSGASKIDPWGTPYGMCVWNHGPDNTSCSSTHLQGVENSNYPVIALISAGPDRVFQTGCQDHPNYVNFEGDGDDQVVPLTYNDAQVGSGGLWDAIGVDNAEIDRNIKVLGEKIAEFTGQVNLTGNSQLQLGANSLLLPLSSVENPACSAGNVNILRINTGYTPPTVEICDGTDWVSVALGDPDMGQWSKNGADIYYKWTGNVGIGVNPPTQKLDVVGNIKLTGDLMLGGGIKDGDALPIDATGSIQLSAGDAAYEMTINDSDIDVTVMLDAEENIEMANTKSVVWDGGGSITGTAAGNLELTKNVGIGKTPGEELSVAGDIELEEDLWLTNGKNINWGNTAGSTGLTGATGSNEVTIHKNLIVDEDVTLSNGNLDVGGSGNIKAAGLLDINGAGENNFTGSVDASDYQWNNVDFTPDACGNSSFVRWTATGWQCGTVADAANGDEGGLGLDDLNDVNLTSETTDDCFYYNGSDWVNISCQTLYLPGVFEYSGGAIRAKDAAADWGTADFVIGSSALGGGGSKMYFDKSKRAFRVGGVSGTEWNDANVGNYSTAFGQDVTASGDNSVAFGLGDATGTSPIVSGAGSFGVFMGDQAGKTVSAANTLALLGGTMVIGDVAATTGGEQDLELDVEGDLGAAHFCDANGNNCFSAYDVSSNNSGVFELNGTDVRTKNTVAPWVSSNFIIGSGQMNEDVAGTDDDTRMFFEKSTGAFRAGTVDGVQWDTRGANSVAFGTNTTASSDYSMAWGQGASANTGTNATAWGVNTVASGARSTAFGLNTTASGDGSTAWGGNATASGLYSTARGRNTTASGTYSTVQGIGATASGFASNAFGRLVIAGNGTPDNTLGAGNGNYTFAIGLLDGGQTTAPMITGDRSMGIFMGAGADSQSGVNLTASDTFGLFGGRMLIDPQAPAQEASVSTGDQQLELDVEGDIGAQNFCDEDGNKCFSAADVLGSPFETDDLTTPTLVRTKNTAAPWATVDFVFGDDDMLGAGAKFLFDKATGAFRAGTVTGTQWDTLGINSTAFGSDTTVTGNYSTAFGRNGTVSGQDSFGIFMGDQTGVTLATANTMLLAGGKLIIDPSVPASMPIAPYTTMDVHGTIKIGDSSELCTADGHEGALRFVQSSNTFDVCADNTKGWQPLPVSEDLALDSLSDASTDYTTDHNILIGDKDDVVDAALTAGAQYNTIIGEAAFQATLTNTADNNTGLGYGVLAANTSGGSNVAIGTGAMTANDTGGNNVAVGVDAMKSNTTASRNTAVGRSAMLNTTTGYYNTALGFESLKTNSTGGGNTALGYQALANATTANNTAVGAGAAGGNTTGGGNTAIGQGALARNQTGGENVAIGNAAAYGSATAVLNRNVFVGMWAGGYDLATVGSSVHVGYQSGQKVTSANGNVLLGYQAGGNVTTGSNNTMIGYQAGGTATTGAKNIIIGYQGKISAADANEELNIGGILFGDIGDTSHNPRIGAHKYCDQNLSNCKTIQELSASSIDALSDGYTDYTTDHNLIMGKGAGANIVPDAQFNTIIGEDAFSAVLSAAGKYADGNVGLGYRVLNANSSGYGNIAVGSSSMEDNTSGDSNTAVGNSALSNNTTGNGNVAIGYDAMKANTGGSGNVAIGKRALDAAESASGSIAIGSDALTSQTSGTNVAIGMKAMFSNSTGSSNTALGHGAMEKQNTGSNNVAIGYYAGIGAASSSSSHNIFIGAGTASVVTTAQDNVFIGSETGSLTTSGSTNILIGRDIEASSATASEELNIGNILFGDIGTTSSDPRIGAHKYCDENLSSCKTITDLSASSINDLDDGYADYATDHNVILGHNGDNIVTGAQHNTVLGDGALAGVITDWADDTTAIGYHALNANTSGQANTAIGSNALAANTTGWNSVAVGQDALSAAVAGDNVAVGQRALQNITENSNTAIGNRTMQTATTGNQNTVLGYSAMATATDAGTSNVAIGFRAMYDANGGDNNVAVGGDALRNNTGINNTAIGSGALTSNTTGRWNVAIGDSAAGNSNVDRIVAIGDGALGANTSGSDNTAVGAGALGATTTGGSNTAMGRLALYSNLTGGRNTAMGRQALFKSTSSQNTAIGYNAMNSQTTGNNNTALGDQALYRNTGGSNNVAIGSGAGAGVNGVTSTSNNVFLGVSAGAGITTGGENIFIGNGTGSATTTGTRNVLLGYQVNASSATASEELNIGNILFGDIGTTSSDPRIGAKKYCDENLANCKTASSLLGSALWQPGAEGSEIYYTADNVGIGTNNPTVPLEVVGAANALQGNFKSTGSGYAAVAITSASATDASILALSQNTGQQWNITNTGTSGNFRIADSTNSLVPFTIEPATPANTLYLDSTGNVGIGTTSPNAKLDVGNGFILSGTTSSTGGSLILAGQYGGSIDDVINTFGGQYSSAGTVIGYATKPKPGASGYVSSADNVAWARGALNLDSSGFHVLLGTAQNVAVGSDVSMSEYFTVKNNGNVGIGTTAPATKLDVAGTIKIANGGETCDATHKGAFRYNSTSGEFEGCADGVDWGEIGGAGLWEEGTGSSIYYNAGAATKVGIGKSNPAVELDVVGNIHYTGHLADVSDRRLKENIKPLGQMGSLLDKINAVDTYSFTMKADPKHEIEYGVMAQELELIFPELVNTAKDEMGTKSVNYIELIPPMIEATKELSSETDILKAEIAALKAEREEMKLTLASMQKDIKGLKGYTGYGTSKAEIGLWMLIGMMLSAGLGFALVSLQRRRA